MAAKFIILFFDDILTIKSYRNKVFISFYKKNISLMENIGIHKFYEAFFRKYC